ncbi:MAG TPA: IclR family transcriptional regulator C-terminal domain-containing protein [Pilimelia sp.]|nr:IclR family transcriptional regulator C-terminal domain-containing protein [Pilimelia sp.]
MAHDGFGLSAMSAWRADMLARTTGETVWIGHLVNDKIHVIHQAVPHGNLSQPVRGDSVLPWYASALGHAIVAGLDAAIQEALLAVPAGRLTGLTVTRPEELRQILVATRQRGYAVEAHMATLGDAGIAAPVFATDWRTAAAIGIVGPAERLLPAERQRSLADAVRLAAQGLSHEASAQREDRSLRGPQSQASYTVPRLAPARSPRELR